MDFDFNEADKQSEGGMMYPEGDYTVAIQDWEYVTASTGTEQIRWHGVIVDGPTAIGGRITDHTPLTQKSAWRLGKFLKGCGINIKGLGKMKIKSPEFSKVLNLTRNRLSIWKVLVDDNPKGGKRNKVDDYVRPPDQDVIDATELLEGEVPDFLKDPA